MSRPTLTQAEFASAPRITPSGYGEEGYQPRRVSMPIGPAGLAVPSARSTFRPTIDGPLLVNIAKRAYADWKARELPEAWADRIREMLAEDLRERFPATDMAVLKRYGATVAITRMMVTMDDGQYQTPVYVDLSEPLDLPANAATFRRLDQGAGASIPPATANFFARVAEVRTAQRPQFTDVVGWPSRFRVREKRWPSWREIEQAWPRLGEWLSDQRAQIAAADKAA